jgi:hypothetical protein
MSIASKVTALLEALRGESFGGMSPVERRHIADLCRFIADKADCGAQYSAAAPAAPGKERARNAIAASPCERDTEPKQPQQQQSQGVLADLRRGNRQE